MGANTARERHLVPQYRAPYSAVPAGSDGTFPAAASRQGWLSHPGISTALRSVHLELLVPGLA
ncbi:hypothetical protein [Streptomyces sp. NPDC056628]|uniref:hypothetical protein n=1 Tax=Streptomyces sp. NPDC056628 TaxID=3345882 RepID=UPI0036C0DCFD